MNFIQMNKLLLHIESIVMSKEFILLESGISLHYKTVGVNFQYLFPQKIIEGSPKKWKSVLQYWFLR